MYRISSEKPSLKQHHRQLFFYFHKLYSFCRFIWILQESCWKYRELICILFILFLSPTVNKRHLRIYSLKKKNLCKGSLPQGTWRLSLLSLSPQWVALYCLKTYLKLKNYNKYSVWLSYGNLLIMQRLYAIHHLLMTKNLSSVCGVYLVQPTQWMPVAQFM